jgi:hypothetical protein
VWQQGDWADRKKAAAAITEADRAKVGGLYKC